MNDGPVNELPDKILPTCESAASISLRYKLEPLLTIGEVAIYLRKPKGSIYNMVSEGKIPTRKVGRELRFSPKDIKDWLDRNAKREIE